MSLKCLSTRICIIHIFRVVSHEWSCQHEQGMEKWELEHQSSHQCKENSSPKIKLSMQHIHESWNRTNDLRAKEDSIRVAHTATRN